MSNKSLRKKNPFRNKAFKRLRSLGGVETITLYNGAEVVVNPMKHFLLQKAYKYKEFQNHMIRKIGNYIKNDEENQQKSKPSADVQVEILE